MIHHLVFCSSILFLLASGGVALAKNAESQNQFAQTASPTVEISPSAPQKVAININTVDIITLQKIKGMSKRKAQSIINYRTKNGPFKSLDELLNVKCRGINKNWLDKISEYLTL